MLLPSLNTKDKCYKEHNATIGIVPNQEQLFILSDLNARVGADHDSWPTCLGHHRIGRMNDNGQHLIGFYSFSSLCITNMYFKRNPQHRITWRHLRSKHWHQLDLIITRHTKLNSVWLNHSYLSTDCDTNHSLVCCKVKLLLKRMYHSKKERKPCIYANKTHHS